eukprot:scaffold118661_cov42-Cyclotella_meneghiniana.AAC.2
MAAVIQHNNQPVFGHPLPPTIHLHPWASADALASLVAALLTSPPSPQSQFTSQPDSTSPAHRYCQKNKMITITTRST